MPIFVKGYARAGKLVKGYTRKQSGFAVTSFNRKAGRAIEAKGLTKSQAHILKGQLRRGDSKGTLHRSTYFVKKYFN
jgi:hypothetical protein